MFKLEDIAGGFAGSQCHTCHLISQKEGIEKKLASLMYRKMQVSSRTPKINAPHTTELCDGIIQAFGSLDEFVRIFKQQIDFAMDHKPGGKVVMDAFKTIITLVESSTKHRMTAPDVFDMPDADLEKEIIDILARSMMGSSIKVEEIDVADLREPV